MLEKATGTRTRDKERERKVEIMACTIYIISSASYDTAISEDTHNNIA